MGLSSIADVWMTLKKGLLSNKYDKAEGYAGGDPNWEVLMLCGGSVFTLKRPTSSFI